VKGWSKGVDESLIEPMRLLSAGQLMAFMAVPEMVTEPLNVEQETMGARSASEETWILLAHPSFEAKEVGEAISSDGRFVSEAQIGGCHCTLLSIGSNGRCKQKEGRGKEGH